MISRGPVQPPGTVVGQWHNAYSCNGSRQTLTSPPDSVLCLESRLVNWCFEPSQPLGIASGLKETFIKRYIVERTNEAEIRPEAKSEKTDSSRGIVDWCFEPSQPLGIISGLKETFIKIYILFFFS